MKQKQVTTEMVLKLPQWAQEFINHINRLRFEAEQRLKKSLDGQTPSNVFVWEPWVKAGKDKVFIQSDQVAFKLSTGNVIQVRAEGDHVTVMGIGFGELTIKPHVSNVVTIKHG
jgi:hypothetical protein